ncbi:hypothetical protein Slala05_84980 [Streptomyces lavendulae subsp. lavendulae]|nr:hypothetical protein Slala05_84980 [Streptomyces lavendulae subsp. lavendulae]
MFSLVTGAILHDRSYTVPFTVPSGRRIGDRDRYPVGGDDGLVRDDTAWWALDLLHGTDVPADESGAYLHDDEQLRAWLQRRPPRSHVRSGCVKAEGRGKRVPEAPPVSGRY